MDKVKFLSDEWRDEVEKFLKAELTPEALKHASYTSTLIYQDCPDGTEKYLYYELKNGEFKSIVLGIGNPPKSEIGVTGTYDTYGKLARGELKAQKALLTKKLKISGSMSRALQLTGVNNSINKVLATIPTEF